MSEYMPELWVAMDAKIQIRGIEDDIKTKSGEN